MGKTYNYKISKEQQLKMHRKANREADIANNTPRVKHTVERSKKEYNRQENKRIVW